MIPPNLPWLEIGFAFALLSSPFTHVRGEEGESRIALSGSMGGDHTSTPLFEDGASSCTTASFQTGIHFHYRSNTDSEGESPTEELTGSDEWENGPNSGNRSFARRFTPILLTDFYAGVVPVEDSPIHCEIDNNQSREKFLFYPDHSLAGGLESCDGNCRILLGWIDGGEFSNGQTGAGIHLEFQAGSLGSFVFSPIHLPGTAGPTLLFQREDDFLSGPTRTIKNESWKNSRSRLEKTSLAGGGTGHRIFWSDRLAPFTLYGSAEIQMHRIHGQLVPIEFEEVGQRFQWQSPGGWGLSFTTALARSYGRIPAETWSFDGNGENLEGFAFRASGELVGNGFRAGGQILIPEPATRSGTLPVLQREKTGYLFPGETPIASRYPTSRTIVQIAPGLSSYTNPDPDGPLRTDLSSHQAMIECFAGLEWEGLVIQGSILHTIALATMKVPEQYPFAGVHRDRDRVSWLEATLSLRFKTGETWLEWNYTRLHEKTRQTPTMGKFTGETVTLGYGREVSL